MSRPAGVANRPGAGLAGTVGAIAAVTAGATLLATARYGMGLTPDSVVYLDGARSLAHGHGYTQNGIAITSFAPGYSAVLSLLIRAGLGAETAARLLAVVAFTGTVVLGHLLVRRHVRSPKIVAAATVVIGCSTVLLGVYKEALSEHLFLVVALLFVLVVEELSKKPARPQLLAAAIVLAWAGFYLRYAGIVLGPLAALVVLVATWRRGAVAAVVRAAVVGALSASAPALWMARNVHAGSAALGARESAAASLPTNVARTGETLAGWLVFESPLAVRVLAVVAFVAGAVIVALAARVTRAQLTGGILAVWPLALFVCAYVGYLMLTASIVAFAAIDTRFLIPVYVPLVVLGAWAFERVTPHLEYSRRKVFVALAVVWVGLSVLAFGARAVRSAHDGAGGYSVAYWHDSRLMDDVRHLSSSTPIYTNDYLAVELLTGRHVSLSVERTYFASDQTTGRLPSFVQHVACVGTVKLVWFLPNSRPRLYSPADLGKVLTLVPAVKEREGVIYDVTSRPGQPAPAASQCD